MLRALTLAMLFAVLPGAAPGQVIDVVGVLHIKITLTDANQASIPVPGHALLISDNPATSTPRRVVTAPDGTVDVRLRPGNYTVESDAPFTFDGKGYQWTQTLDIPAGRDVILELTARNAEVGAAPAPTLSPGSPASAASKENDPSLLLPQWKDSVVAVWTPESRASGFLVHAGGLVVTNQRVIGSATAVEVQLTPSVKVAARVLVVDRVRDVAVLWIDPAIAASVRPVPLECAGGPRPPFADGQKVVAIGAPLRGQRDVSSGQVIRVEPHASVADFRLAPGSIGGQVFSRSGDVVGISSVVDDQNERNDERRRSRDARIVPVDDACEAIRSAEKAMQTAQRPVATLLPLEPLRPFPTDALDAAVQRRVGNLSPYRMTSSDFDIAFLTPVLVSGAQHNTQQANTPVAETLQRKQPEATDFGDWSDYFADVPPVLVVRVTPKLVESFWTTVARGAAYTQGAALPAIKHFKPGFSRLRAFCGDVEVTPIHPFTVEQRVSETDAVREGLYVYDHQALGPHCKSVKLVLSSEKAPEKQDSVAVDPKVIERIWQDFAPYRALVAASSDGRP
jgi:hypothetical protein